MSVAFVADTEDVSGARVVEQCGSIDEKHSPVDIAFCTRLGKKCE